MTSRIPNAFNRVRVISSKVRPLSWTRALGRVSVSGRRRVPSPAARIIAFIAETLQLKMTHHDFHSVLGAKAFGQLLREIHRPVLPSGATERDHQILEPALLIAADTRIHERQHARKKLVHAFLLIQVVNYRRIFSCQALEAFLAAGIRKAAPVENESAAIPRFVLRQFAVERKTENADHKIFRFRSQTQELL